MADEILKRIRSTLHQSQQFRNRPSEKTEEHTKVVQERVSSIPVRDNRKVNFAEVEPRRTRQTQATTEDVSSDESKSKVQLSKKRSLERPTISKQVESTQRNKDEDDDPTTSSITFSFTSDENSAKPKKTRPKKIPPKIIESLLPSQPKPEVEQIATSESIQSLESIRTAISSSIQAGSISSKKSSKKSSTPKIKVRSLTESSSAPMNDMNSRVSDDKVRKNRNGVKNPSDSLAEISEQLDASESIKILDEIPEDTMSYISSIKVSEVKNENEIADAAELSSETVESARTTSAENSLIEIDSFSSSRPFTEVKSLSSAPPKSPSRKKSEELSERIESIIQNLSSVHESLKSRTYSSSFDQESMSKSKSKSSQKQKSLQEGSDDSYEEDFLEEDEEDSESKVSPEDQVIVSNQSEKSSTRKSHSTLKSKSLNVVQIPVIPVPLKAKVPKKDRKSGRVKVKTKVTKPVFEESESESVIPDYAHYATKSPKHKIQRDYKHHILLNDPQNLPALCKDLIQSVVDSNERMYHHTMEAAESMTRMYHRNRKNKETKNNAKTRKIIN